MRSDQFKMSAARRLVTALSLLGYIASTALAAHGALYIPQSPEMDGRQFDWVVICTAVGLALVNPRTGEKRELPDNGDQSKYNPACHAVGLSSGRITVRDANPDVSGHTRDSASVSSIPFGACSGRSPDPIFAFARGPPARAKPKILRRSHRSKQTNNKCETCCSIPPRARSVKLRTSRST